MSAATDKVYKSFVKQIETQLNMKLCDALEQDNLVYNHIENQTLAAITKRNKHFNCIKYIKENNLNIEYEFDKRPLQALRKELPNRTELRDKLTNITNPEHKLIFSLLLNYENVLRTDLALVKLSNYNEGDSYYKDGVIYFPTILKTKTYKKIEIPLSDEDKLLVNFSKDYLIGSIISKDRSNTFSKYVKKLSKIYFDTPLTITCFRKMVERQLLSELEIDATWIEKYNKLKQEVSKRGHDIQTCIQYYV
jgi:hypothetical protein